MNLMDVKTGHCFWSVWRNQTKCKHILFLKNDSTTKLEMCPSLDIISNVFYSYLICFYCFFQGWCESHTFHLNMAEKVSDTKIRHLLVEAITMLCKNGMQYESDVVIDGLLAITVDQNQVTVIPIKETIQSSKPPVEKPVQRRLEETRDRKRRRHSSSHSDSSESSEKKSNSGRLRTDSVDDSKAYRYDATAKTEETVSGFTGNQVEAAESQDPSAFHIDEVDSKDVIIIKEEVTSDEECNEIESMVTNCNNSVNFGSNVGHYSRTGTGLVPGPSLSGGAVGGQGQSNGSKSSVSINSLPTWTWDCNLGPDSI